MNNMLWAILLASAANGGDAEKTSMTIGTGVIIGVAIVVLFALAAAMLHFIISD